MSFSIKAALWEHQRFLSAREIQLYHAAHSSIGFPHAERAYQEWKGASRALTVAYHYCARL